MKISRTLFRAARIAATTESLRSPKTATRRGKNIVVGRTLAKVGFWRRLWK